MYLEDPAVLVGLETASLQVELSFFVSFFLYSETLATTDSGRIVYL